MIRPMITSMVNPLVAAIKRTFIQLDDAIPSYYSYVTTLDLESDDTFEFDFLAPNGVTTGSEYLTDGDGVVDAQRAWVLLASNGTYNMATGFTLEVDNLLVTGADNYPIDGKLHKAKITATTTKNIKYLGTRFTMASFYNGILANPVATISSVTTTNTLGLSTGNSEPSEEANNTITYVDIPDSDRESFQLSGDKTQWDNISPLPQELPAVIEIASIEAIAGITEVWIYGASISDALITNYETVFSQQLTALGYSGITFVDKSIGGRGVTPTLSAWNAEKAAVTGRGDILVVFHCIGNDVSDNRPWSTLSQPNRDTLINDYASLVTSIADNGNVPMPVGTSFRDYDATTINNEQAGSLPFNEAIVNPALPLTSLDMSDGNGKPYLTMYNFVRNSSELILSSPDPVHLNKMGDQLNRNLWADSIYARLSGNAPIAISRIENPVGIQAIPRDDITLFTNNFDSNRGSRALFGGNDIYNCVDFSLSPTSGYLPSSVTLTQPLTLSGVNTNGFDTGDVSQSLLNDKVKDGYVYTQSATWVILQTRKGYNVGQSVTLEIAVFRNSGVSRVGDYSIDGGSTFISLNASPPSVDHYHTFNAVADGNGEIELMGRVSAGSSFCYLSGTNAIPQ